MLFDPVFFGPESQEVVALIRQILESPTEYSLIGSGDGWEDPPVERTGAADVRLRHRGNPRQGRLGHSPTPENIATGLPAMMMEQSTREGRWEGLLTGVRKNGQRFLALAVQTPHFDPSGRHTGYLLISKDVTTERTRFNKTNHAVGYSAETVCI